jgi:hypothetical protein
MAQITLNSTGVASSGALALQSNGTTAAATIDTSQNLLVNTTNAGVGGLSVSVSKNINFAEDATQSYATLFRQSSSATLCLNYGYQIGNGADTWSSSIGTSTTRSSIAVGAGTLRFYTDTASTVVVGTNITPTERVRITSAGDVGIGTISPTYKLDVAGFSRGAIVHRTGSYSTGATTPSVSGVTVLYISNSSATTITNFTDGVNEQVIYLYFNDSNTTINRSNAYLAGGVNFVSTLGDMLVLMKNGSNWFEISRSVNA